MVIDKDLGPRADSGGALVLLDCGEAETEFIVRACRSARRKVFGSFHIFRQVAPRLASIEVIAKGDSAVRY